LRQDERCPFVKALHSARISAYPPGEYVEQESFMRASEILDLARRAGIGPGVTVLDLCCGVAGPGRYVTRRLGCRYLGVDLSASAVEIARQRAAGLDCRFAVWEVPPVPAGPFEVVVLLETLLAFREKEPLLHQIASALSPGGRFAFTLEEGAPMTAVEAAAMPDADTVWLIPEEQLVANLESAGLAVRWRDDHSRSHLETVDALIAAFEADREAITAQVGRRALDELLTGHRLWSRWLREGRVRKLAFVAEA
jgi:SAM-dependent methyltransferase